MKDFADGIRDKPGEFERRYRTFFGPKADPALVDSVVASARKATDRDSPAPNSWAWRRPTPRRWRAR